MAKSELAPQPMKTTPKDFFLWVAAIIALYVSAVSLIALWFEYTDRLFADPLARHYDPFSAGIRTAVASLIVLFPLYLWLTRILNQGIRREPEKKEIWVRRWLLYFTVFAAGVTVVCDLIVLINRFLGGDEITASFLLKVLAVFVVAGGAFLYYLQDLRGTWERNERASLTIGGVTSLIVAISVVSAFFVIGLPWHQRLARHDHEKTRALQTIQFRVAEHFRRTRKLPAALAELADPIGGFVVPADPQGEQFRYEYNRTGELSFELCATFNRPSPGFKAGGAAAPVRVEPQMLYAGRPDYYWQHGAGRTCFSRTIDPQRYPPPQQPR